MIRIFSLTAVLVATLIAAWLAASWMLSLTGGNGRARLPVWSPAGVSIQTRGGPIDMANGLASTDRARREQMEELSR